MCGVVEYGRDGHHGEEGSHRKWNVLAKAVVRKVGATDRSSLVEERSGAVMKELVSVALS
jgi:hypothetical protein